MHKEFALSQFNLSVKTGRTEDHERDPSDALALSRRAVRSGRKPAPLGATEVRQRAAITPVSIKAFFSSPLLSVLPSSPETGLRLLADNNEVVLAVDDETGGVVGCD